MAVRIHEGFGHLKELQKLDSIKAYHDGVGFAKDLKTLTKLKVLSVEDLTIEIGRIIGAFIEKMDHLEELYMDFINKSEPVDLQVYVPPSLRSLGLNCQLHEPSCLVPKLQNLQNLYLGFSSLKPDTFKVFAGLCNLVCLMMKMSYDGEEMHFGEGSFLKLKELHLYAFEGLKSLKVDRGALPRLEELALVNFPLMTEMSSGIRNLTSLKSLQLLDMRRELVARLQPNGGVDYQNVRHIASISIRYMRNDGGYENYRLGSSELQQRLQERTSS